jgi:hypothetical protein
LDGESWAVVEIRLPSAMCKFILLFNFAFLLNILNSGFFVRYDDEWEWLRSLMTIPKMIELLGPEYNGKKVERFEMKNIRAVHFQLNDHLDRSYNASSTYDGLGKNVCEYLRSVTPVVELEILLITFPEQNMFRFLLSFFDEARSDIS